MKSTGHYLPQIVAILFIAFLPHIQHLPGWVVLWALICWGYALAGIRWKLPVPSGPARSIAGFTGFAILLFSLGHFWGMSFGASLLSIMLGLKTLEIRTHRDRMLTVFATNFLILSGLFYSESLARALYITAALLLTNSVLLHLNCPDQALKKRLRFSGIIILQALPLAAALFLIFPRVRPGLGFKDPSIGITGFSNHLKPGDISRLVKSDEVAFRATFEDSLPEASMLYWRGLVLSNFDGETWRNSEEPPLRFLKITGSDPVEYTITLEPHGERWLFALDLPVQGPPGTRVLTDHTVLSYFRLKSRIRYRVKSLTRYETGRLVKWDENTLALPPEGNPRSRKLASDLVVKSGSPREVVDAALEYFNNKPFFYSTSPPSLSRRDPVDDFLFNTKKGFCEHYANAFTFLMRAAGIRSRIVVGYRGGQLNPIGNYIIVRQSHAHAWSEVFLPQYGWGRVDPTNAIDPSRIESQSINELISNEIPGYFAGKSSVLFLLLWKKTVFAWDALNFLGNQWLVSYDYYRQRQVLSLFGIRLYTIRDRFRALLWIPVTVVVFAIIAGLLILCPVRFSEKDRIQEYYLIFCKRLASAGHPRIQHQGPRNYEEAIIVARPDLKTSVRKIINLYVLLRYGRNENIRSFRKFKQAVSHFQPRARKACLLRKISI